MSFMNRFKLPIFLFLICSLLAPMLSVEAQNRWSRRVKEIYYPSAADNSQQPALVYAPKSDSKRPLLVALHTWSNDFLQEGGQPLFGEWCRQNDWFLIHPNFRGKNRTPKALGSDLAVGDIVSAVEYMVKTYNVDEDRIYLTGTSGGGHMSLLMAGRHPEIWAGVSAWCPITDIQTWWEQKSVDKKNKRYATEIEKALGGRPGIDEEATEQARYRSPLTYLSRAGGVNLDINHGIDDGRKGSVPFTHSLLAFNRVVTGKDAISEEDIDSFYATQTPPADGSGELKDPAYGNRRPLYRKIGDNTRITIFKGGHEIVHEASLNWLRLQRKGQAPVWEVNEIIKID